MQHLILLIPIKKHYNLNRLDNICNWFKDGLMIVGGYVIAEPFALLGILNFAADAFTSFGSGQPTYEKGDVVYEVNATRDSYTFPFLHTSQTMQYIIIVKSDKVLIIEITNSLNYGGGFYQ